MMNTEHFAGELMRFLVTEMAERLKPEITRLVREAAADRAPAPEWISEKELAERLGVSKQWVTQNREDLNWKQAGKLYFYDWNNPFRDVFAQKNKNQKILDRLPK